MRFLAAITAIAAVTIGTDCAKRTARPLSETVVSPAAREADTERMADWPDANLYGTVALWALDRHAESGIEALNDVERTVAALFLFHNEVNNGGFGQWLYQTPCDLLAATRASLERIGARRMSAFVAPIIEQSGGDTLFRESTREAHLDSLPDRFHEALERKSIGYGQLEDEFLAHVYRYVRENWKRVRRASPSGPPDSE